MLDMYMFSSCNWEFEILPNYKELNEKFCIYVYIHACIHLYIYIYIYINYKDLVYRCKLKTSYLLKDKFSLFTQLHSI